MIRLRKNDLCRCYALASVRGCKIQSADVAGPVFDAALCLTGGFHPVVAVQRAVTGVPCLRYGGACVIIIGFRIADLCSHLLVVTDSGGFGLPPVRSIKAELHVSAICGDLRRQIIAADGKGHVKGIRIRGILAVCSFGTMYGYIHTDVFIILRPQYNLNSRRMLDILHGVFSQCEYQLTFRISDSLVCCQNVSII